MKTGPKYKIAKRLGAPIYEKTQTQKFAVSEARGGRNRKRFSKPSDYKRQLLEKQKMRLTYGLSEGQFRRYVNEAIERSDTPTTALYLRLEQRLDNVVYRLGLVKTRRLARQIVTHGHITVNGRKLNVPSHRVQKGDEVAVREGSKNTGLFIDLANSFEARALPNWLTFDVKNLSGAVTGEPVYQPSESYFDPEQVLEFYSR